MRGPQVKGEQSLSSAWPAGAGGAAPHPFVFQNCCATEQLLKPSALLSESCWVSAGNLCACTCSWSWKLPRNALFHLQGSVFICIYLTVVFRLKKVLDSSLLLDPLWSLQLLRGSLFQLQEMLNLFFVATLKRNNPKT